MLVFLAADNGNSTESSLDSNDIWKPRMREVMVKLTLVKGNMVSH